MKWKKNSDLIIAAIFSLAYIIVTFLIIIGPLHMNQYGNTNGLGKLSGYSIIYLLLALLITWGIYYYLQKKPERLFFSLFICGIVFIIAGIFLWGLTGS